MKNFLLSAAFALSGIGVLAGCSKTSSAPVYAMAASVGGTAFNVSNCYAISNGTDIAIEGYGGTQAATTFPVLTINLSGYNKTTATFKLDTLTAGTGNFAEYHTSMTDVKYSKSGTVTITSVSPITGTFSFTATDGTSFTNGTFTAIGN